MKRTKHAKDITDRFREMVEQDGNTLADKHYDELALLIEAGIDTALVEKLEKIADKVNKLAGNIRNDAELFS
ncbi:hypothetical protein MNBD_GAMMA21-57 [hydrothermal vent metagenome]|uniref:Uncharacterized protein n=1 Tax=hydrothermal vent metagenome TaxID=652676 RepID=A0A3B1AD93_9ZZZZ